MRWLVLLLLVLAPLEAAVDGIVKNMTSGVPQPGVSVTLYRVSGREQMEPLKTVKTDSEGRFSFEESPQGMGLLQTVYDGVTYNEMLRPGAKTTGLELHVYRSSPKPSGVRVTEHMILLEPMGKILHVSESILYMNTGKQVYSDSRHGVLKVYLPPEIRGKPVIMATAPGGMPVERPAEKTVQANVYKIDFPVKPGETRFDITYVLPEPESHVFSGKALHKGGRVRIVVPEGVTLSGEGLKLIGREPTTQAAVYETAGPEYSVKFTGSGSLRSPEAETSSGGGPGIEQILPRIYDRAGWIVALSLAILLLGFVILYRRGEGESELVQAVRPSSRKGKRH